ncbi:hypothetical protein CDL12_13837 [Handroanthus impetiginosus]|uniref:SAC domain-containing protein n=1 Tax=Handroanthus impetiginosus TaxID=429701 RepID=A0A2G9H8A5_9LAMI|nr:hypothetical protein CDL12_13837 [Handroanthus impetiginosus]
MLTGFFYCQVTPELLPEGHLKWPSFENVVDPDISSIYSNSDIEKHDYDENEDSDNSDRKSSGSNSIGNNSNPSIRPVMVQKGVLRTNCIDCLDRTNVAQYAYGLAALGHQLHALGVTTSTKIDLDDPLADVLMGCYERMGDTLAHQYGGSAAHNKIFSERRGHSKAAIQSQEFFRTLQRYYSNAYTDAEKQNAINVFLGNFQPQPGKPDVWELEANQHYRGGGHGHSNIDENGRSLFQRSLSEGHILRESLLLMSSSNSNRGFTSADFSSKSKGGTKMLSESTPEISTSETELAFSRFSPPMPTKELFAEMQRDRHLEHENGEASDCSNFVDLDWLSSSGNSCEEEMFERSMLTTSPTALLSAENVVNEIVGETTPSISECGSSMRRREYTGTDLSYDEAHNYEALEDFSDSFVRWVTYGETLCH